MEAAKKTASDKTDYAPVRGITNRLVATPSKDKLDGGQRLWRGEMGPNGEHGDQTSCRQDAIDDVKATSFSELIDE